MTTPTCNHQWVSYKYIEAPEPTRFCELCGASAEEVKPEPLPLNSYRLETLQEVRQ
jgi:hypothetical protein